MAVFQGFFNVFPWNFELSQPLRWTERLVDRLPAQRHPACVMELAKLQKSIFGGLDRQVLSLCED